MSSIYFRQSLPVRVDRQRQYMSKSRQMQFHINAISEIKNRVGNKCSFLSHLSSKKEIDSKLEPRIYFLAHLNINGEVKKVRFDTGKSTADELIAEDYKALKDLIDEYNRG